MKAAIFERKAKEFDFYNLKLTHPIKIIRPRFDHLLLCIRIVVISEPWYGQRDADRFFAFFIFSLDAQAVCIFNLPYNAEI